MNTKSNILNIKHYRIMCLHRIEYIKQKLNKDILIDDDYLEFYNIDKKNTTEIDQMRAESKNISEFLINITNKEKYTPKQIYDNLNKKFTFVKNKYKYK